MSLSIQVDIPKLKWKPFTVKHCNMQCSVYELDVTYHIGYVDTDKEGNWLFNLRVTYGSSVEILQKRVLMELAKSSAEHHYESLASNFLSKQGKFFILSRESKDDES